MKRVRAVARLFARYGFRAIAAVIALRLVYWAFSCVGAPATGSVALSDAVLTVFTVAVAMGVAYLAGFEAARWRRPRPPRWWEVDS